MCSDVRPKAVDPYIKVGQAGRGGPFMAAELDAPVGRVVSRPTGRSVSGGGV